MKGYVRQGIPVPGVSLVGVPNMPQCRVPLLRSYRTYRSVGYRYLINTDLTEVSGAGIEFVPNHSGVFGRVLRTYRQKYPYPRYFGGRNTGGVYLSAVPKLPKCRALVLSSY